MKISKFEGGVKIFHKGILRFLCIFAIKNFKIWKKGGFLRFFMRGGFLCLGSMWYMVAPNWVEKPIS